MLGQPGWRLHETVYETWSPLRLAIAGKNARPIVKPWRAIASFHAVASGTDEQV